MYRIANVKPITLIAVVFAVICSCSNPSSQPSGDIRSHLQGFSSDSVSLIYLHQKKGCKTCRAISEAMQRATVRFKATAVAFRDIDINSAKGKVLAQHFSVSYAGVVVYRQDSQKSYFTNITADAFLFATTRPDSLDMIIERTIRSHLSKMAE